MNHLTIVFRYTLDGSRPGPRSRGWQRTARCDQGVHTIAYGRWGEAAILHFTPLAIASPGSRMRVWVEWRSLTGIVGALRADTSTKGGKVSWATDAAGCRTFPNGCDPLRLAPLKVVDSRAQRG